jgi:hypothetical protein
VPKAVTNPLRWRKRAQEEEQRRKRQAASVCTKCRKRPCACTHRYRDQTQAVKDGHVVRKKELRAEYLALGLCMCGAEPVPGRKLCNRCAATVRRNAAKLKARDPDYQARYYRERRKAAL